MARKQDVMPSKYLKASNYPDDWTLNVEIEMGRLEKFPNNGKDEEKLVVYFRKQKSGLVVGSVVCNSPK